MAKLDDFQLGTIVWGGVLNIFIGLMFLALILAGQNDHNFDKACLESGQSIKYETLQGEEYANKVCR